MDPKERARIEAYLKGRLGAKSLQVRARPRKDDSAEVYVEDEFLGVLSRDEEDGELCYHFAMTILDIDLEENA
ncbi:MAG: DUF3126 family protein [Alphaproteobacteria bacterium]|nr:DUF3126 family protein [Alphaproteobacteria bacterium]